MTTLYHAEQLKGTYENKTFDLDRYEFKVRTGMATKEYSIIVDFLNNEICGDCIAYGEWFDIEQDECLPLLQGLKDSEIFRDFKSIIK